MLVLFYLVLMRIVAETGINYVLLPPPSCAPWLLLAQLIARRTLHHDYRPHLLLERLFHRRSYTDDLRESPSVFINHAFRIADSARLRIQPRNWRKGHPSGLLPDPRAWGWLTSFQGAAMLYVEYNYAASLDTALRLAHQSHRHLQHGHGPRASADRRIPPRRSRPAPGSQPPCLPHRRCGHHRHPQRAPPAALPVSPSTPVGYLLVYTSGLRQVWFSIFLGWLAKMLLVRFGGASLFRRSRGFFLGLILGEAFAAAGWMIFSLVCASMGADYKAIHLLPYPPP